jgi:hypothetical protein
MHVRCGWDIRFDAEQYVAQVGGTLPRLLTRPGVRADWEAALADAAEIIEPAAAWDTYPIRELRHERLILTSGATLGGGPLTTVVAGASELAVGVCTAGAAISRRVTEYQHSERRLRAMFLDDLGSWAVDQVRQQLCQTIETEAVARGWQASASLSPGESAWPVTQQSVLFSLLDTQPIGVVLTESLVMSPIKSLSLVIGIGPGPLGVQGASNCDFCTLRERCNYRRLRVTAS